MNKQNCWLVSAKVAKAAAGVTARKFLEPEKDPEKLINYVCGLNVYKEGTDPEIKPDSEYPDWLWSLRTERGSVPLEELPPDSWEYWRRLGKMERKRVALLKKTKYKYKYF